MSSAGSALSPFLFQGSVQQNSGTTTTQGPQWLSSALSGLTSSAVNLAQQPYQQYQGQLTAPLSANQNQAVNLASQNANSYQPYLQQAGALTQAGSQPVNASQFMNPYQNYLTGALTQNFNNNVLPGIQSNFVGAGQSGSPQEAQVMGQAAYNLNNSIGQSLGNEYQGALNTSLAQNNQLLNAGNQTANLGALNTNLGTTGINNLTNTGNLVQQNAQQNLNAGYGQFQNQVQYPYQQLGFLSSILGGINPTAAGLTTNTASNSSTLGNNGLGGILSAATSPILGAIGLAKGGSVQPRAGAFTISRKAA